MTWKNVITENEYALDADTSQVAVPAFIGLSDTHRTRPLPSRRKRCS